MQNKNIKITSEMIIQILRGLEGERAIQNDYSKAHDKLISLLDDVNKVLKDSGKDFLIEKLEQNICETVSLARKQYFEYGKYFGGIGLCFFES